MRGLLIWDTVVETEEHVSVICDLGLLEGVTEFQKLPCEGELFYHFEIWE